MRFHENDAADAAKWLPRPTLKSRPQASPLASGDVVHHNTLNVTAPSQDDAARSREVERFFDLMTPSAPSVQGTPR